MSYICTSFGEVECEAFTDSSACSCDESCFAKEREVCLRRHRCGCEIDFAVLLF